MGFGPRVRNVVLMSTTGANADRDPLAALGALPGVADSVESVRKAVDRVYGHRIMRRRSNEITSEAALRGARGSAALSGADWVLEEVRLAHRLQR
ncbi:Oxidoreductase OS=Streptomyces glaucescens OX=1907 GN=SGLAU_18520 PE=4 SV=1 [Streptomyces glaucescens]